MDNRIVKLWALGFILLGAAIAIYKHYSVGFPLSPQQDTPVWILQAQVDYVGKGGPSKLSLVLPKITPGFRIVDEDFISGRYGLTVDESTEVRKANWAVRRAKNQQRLYYRVTIAQDNSSNYWQLQPPFPTVPDYGEPYQSAVEAILDDVRTASADVETFTLELLNQLNDGVPNENIELIKDLAANSAQWSEVIINMLRGVRVPARQIWGFNINDAANQLTLTPKLQVHNGSRWISFDPYTGERGIPKDFFVWTVGAKPAVILADGKQADLKFSVTRSYAKLLDIVQDASDNRDSVFIKYSLLKLPIQAQNGYRLLLMVPIGALLIVLLRTYVGISSVGTFMPILIALAFRETQLLWGIIAFCIIVSLGLLIRFYFERLMLLLIPRLAAILVIVVMIMLLISTTTNQMGIERLVSVSLFPMVIMAMTIERMSIIWEESGAREAFSQGAGSLVIAILGYLLMTNEQISYLIFVFPELLISVFGLCIWMGKYTGYRLSELLRFRDFLNTRPDNR